MKTCISQHKSRSIKVKYIPNKDKETDKNGHVLQDKENKNERRLVIVSLLEMETVYERAGNSFYCLVEQ